MTQHLHPSEKPQRESRFRVRCPHCNTIATARTSVQLAPTYREVRFECRNDSCGYIWLAGLEAIRTLCASETPNPAIDIPFVAGRPATNSEPAKSAATG